MAFYLLARLIWVNVDWSRFRRPARHDSTSACRAHVVGPSSSLNTYNYRLWRRHKSHEFLLPKGRTSNCTGPPLTCKSLYPSSLTVQSGLHLFHCTLIISHTSSHLVTSTTILQFGVPAIHFLFQDHRGFKKGNSITNGTESLVEKASFQNDNFNFQVHIKGCSSEVKHPSNY